MNRLAQYLRTDPAARLTQSQQAEIFGISRSYLSEIASGAKRPSLDVAFRIERETGGAVPASSWVSAEAAA